MSDSSRAENVFGQVLICLRMSKLDYVVKETPYSAYLTIRKKFAKSAEVASDDNVRVGLDDKIAKYEKIQKENNFLRQKIEEVENGYASLKVTNEEMEIKLRVIVKDKGAYEEENEELLDDLKEANGQKETLKTIRKSLEADLKCKEDRIDQLTKELQSFDATSSCKVCDSETKSIGSVGD